MNRNSGIFAILTVASAIFLAGCWGSSKSVSLGPAPEAAEVSESACAQCHGSSYNSRSGQPIYSGYILSKHFRNDIGEVIGCQGCHGGGSNHIGNVSAAGSIPYPNPDNAARCFGCHQPAFLGRYNAGGVPTAVQRAHYYNASGNIADCVAPAMYVTPNFENGCTACHEAHNPLEGIGKDERIGWAESGHGDTNSPAWAEEDFKSGSLSCIRCHTATGYVNYVTDNYTVPTVRWATAGDNSREVLACRACHLDDGFRLRPAGLYTAHYKDNTGAYAKFPDAERSNLCIACHSGRESMASIKGIPDTGKTFDNASFKNSHYFPAAGIMYMTTGYTELADNMAATASKSVNRDNVSSKPFSYAASYTMYYGSGSTPTGYVSSTHRKLGTTLINGDSHNADFFVAGNADSGGPCVTCHMQTTGQPRRAGRHSWAIDMGASNDLCIECHAGEVDNTAILTVFLEEQGEYFRESLVVAESLLETNFGILYTDAHPYFYELDNTTAVTDWTRGGDLTQDRAMKLMGACYNLNLLTKEPAAYIHGRTYSRRLCYDTIDFLDDGIVNQSTGATVLAFDAVKYQRGADADTDPTTEFYKFLIGYNRTTYQWNIDNALIGYERP